MNEMELKKFAAQIRIDLIKMLKHRRYGHIGGALSIVETLAVLYGDEMKLFYQKDTLVLDYIVPLQTLGSLIKTGYIH